MPNKLDELRSEQRISGKDAIFVCYPSQDGSRKEEKHTCNAEDISQGGIKIVTRRPLPLGCILPIEIQIQDKSIHFSFDGEVKWCLEIDEAPTYFAGIKLVKLDGKSYQQWRNFVES